MHTSILPACDGAVLVHRYAFVVHCATCTCRMLIRSCTCKRCVLFGRGGGRMILRIGRLSTKGLSSYCIALPPTTTTLLILDRGRGWCHVSYTRGLAALQWKRDCFPVRTAACFQHITLAISFQSILSLSLFFLVSIVCLSSVQLVPPPPPPPMPLSRMFFCCCFCYTCDGTAT